MVDLGEPRGLIESLATRLDNEVDGLSNVLGALSYDLGGRIGELEGDVGALETWRIASYPKILTLQDFDLVFMTICVF